MRAAWDKITPRIKLWTILVIVVAFIALVISPSDEAVTESLDRSSAAYVGDSYFEVHYIDVGQGDSALVLCDGDVMLIDGGTSGKSSLIYSYLEKLDVHKLDFIVASHPHDDHVGGLAGALNLATVERVLCSTSSYDSESFEDFVKYVEKNELSIEVPERGDCFELGSSLVEILGVNASGNENDSSIVLKVTFGDTAFLFTGDATKDAEQTLLDFGCDLNSTVLKVGHHGSSDGTTDAFLSAVMPKYAIISAGEDNAYEHPANEILSKLKNAGVITYRTDMQGDIVCKSDGNDVTVTAEKNPDADTLELKVKETFEPAPTLAVETDQRNEGNSHNGDRNSSGGSGNLNIGQLEERDMEASAGTTYVLNTNTKKFHYESCRSAKQIKDKNRAYHTGTREECIDMGYEACGNCHP